MAAKLCRTRSIFRKHSSLRQIPFLYIVRVKFSAENQGEHVPLLRSHFCETDTNNRAKPHRADQTFSPMRAPLVPVAAAAALVALCAHPTTAWRWSSTPGVIFSQPLQPQENRQGSGVIAGFPATFQFCLDTCASLSPAFLIVLVTRTLPSAIPPFI